MLIVPLYWDMDKCTMNISVKILLSQKKDSYKADYTYIFEKKIKEIYVYVAIYTSCLCPLEYRQA